MPQVTFVCDWCRQAIPLNEEVNIDRYDGSEDGPSWDAVFCGDEHASLWVANPVAPIAQGVVSTTWGDRVFFTGVVAAMWLLCVMTCLGVVVTIKWVL